MILKTNSVKFSKLKFIIKICLILLCILEAKTEFNGKWYKLGINWQIYININSTIEGQILEQFIKVANNQNLIYSRKINKSWLGKTYTNTEYEGKLYRSIIKYVDGETIIYGNELYKKYDLPRYFLKGN